MKLLGLASPFQGIWCLQAYGLVGLILLVVVEAVGVVYFKHINREKFATLQTLRYQRDVLHIEWSQLLLEHSTYLAAARVEKVAREKLGMTIPNSIKQIKP